MEKTNTEYLVKNKNVLFKNSSFKIIEKLNLVRNEDVSNIPDTLKVVTNGMIWDLSSILIPDWKSAEEYIATNELDALGNTLERLKSK